jgi:hypothetical protein
VKNPKIPQSASAHSSKNDQLGVRAVGIGAADSRMRLARGRGSPKAGWDLPLKLVRVVTHFQGVQVVQISERGNT